MRRGTWFMMAGLAIVLIIGLAGPHMLRPDRPVADTFVEANVPPAATFDTLLRRDLESYFAPQLAPAAQLEYALLKPAATPSGTDYPKYYAWIEIRAAAGRVTSGAVRLSAIGKQRFEVTHFLPAERVRSNPSELTQTFPLGLLASIKAHADKDL